MSADVSGGWSTSPNPAWGSPEGELWLSVLAGALEDLRDVADWMPRNVDLKRLWPPPPLTRSKRAQLREKLRAARSVLAFFEDDPGSSLEFICGLFDIEPVGLRASARRDIERSRLRERTECAEIWLGSAGLAI